jgi:Domain of unknown function (DUF4034)
MRCKTRLGEFKKVSTERIISLLRGIGLCLCIVQSQAIANVEVKPTFDSSRKLVSFHCIDKDTDLKVSCPDYIEVEMDHLSESGSLFNESRFSALDALYIQLRSGQDRFKDGTWKLSLLEKVIEDHFAGWKNWPEDLKRLKQWQGEHPESVFAKLAEVIYWCSYASTVEYGLNNPNVSESARSIFESRMKNADLVLESMTAQADANPSWYQLALRVKNALGVSKADLITLFEVGQKQFPEHLGIYHSMAQAFETKWGGTELAYDKFALVATKLTEKFQGGGMYARLYSTPSARANLPVKLDPSFPSTKQLLQSFAELHSRYPNSHSILNYYAHLTCKTGDAMKYDSLRKKLGIYVMQHVFTNPNIEVCDRKFAKNIRVAGI